MTRTARISVNSIDNLLENLQQARDTIQEQDQQIDKFVTKELENSINMDTMRKFICTWLQEFEEKFRRLGFADSNTIAEDYVKQARWMDNAFGRKEHLADYVEKWIDSDNLPFKAA